MLQRGRRRGAFVCVLARNYLAAAHLRGVLALDPSFSLVSVCELSTAPRGLKSCAVAVIDRCGLELPLALCVERFRLLCPAARFLVIDKEQGIPEIVQLMVLGVHGFVPHEKVGKSLGPAVRAIADGGLWVPPEALVTFLREANTADRKRAHDPNSLTAREAQILELVRHRLSNREIARLLKIRVSTVKFHLSNILHKLQVHSRRLLHADPSGLEWPGIGT